jgi:hypothetical protein
VVVLVEVLVVVVGAVVVEVLVVEVLVVEVLVVDVVVVGAQGIIPDIALVQAPTDVIVTVDAKSFTITNCPDNNCVLVTLLGETTPISAVRLKVGPKLVPNPLPNVIFISLGILIYYFNIQTSLFLK